MTVMNRPTASQTAARILGVLFVAAVIVFTIVAIGATF